MQKEIISNNESATIALGTAFASNLQRGDVIVLTGDLGARKNKICESEFFVFLAKKMKPRAPLLRLSMSIH